MIFWSIVKAILVVFVIQIKQFLAKNKDSVGRSISVE